ncbi:hypothetical protein [Amycolatopsis taiwanensis]|uniref:Uncharacterized protein n=1 Tax=Amycolatopsis taiwanensis TaxID=342230 RepID=A0A9W6R125_9PSEU|nr:hypothetical protein [Amycolatopsis taiwanensis]GLY67624.1 hypothetical protein Atai01_42430 [Amycolatopsis taiwanensis]
MNTLSTKTLGHLIQVAVTMMSKSDIRDLIMQSGLYDADGMDTEELELRTAGQNKNETLRIPLLDAHKLATRGNRDAHNALLEIVRLGAERIAAWYGQATAKLAALREALVSDGYEMRWSQPGLLPDATPHCRLVPIDPDTIPVGTEITALEAELDSRGYAEAREHYVLAVKHFTEQHYPSANGQLRNMVESLIVNLAVDHTGYSDTGKANQGGQAIKNLYTQGGRPPAVIGQPLPEFDGGRMLHGIWETLHSNGSHPGLSDADEARLRMQLCTALARFLLKHFPTKL